MTPILNTRRALTAGVLLLAALGAATARAQGAPAGDGSRAERMLQTLHKRFGAADANTDGRLTRDEAKSKMPWVYKHFDAIDSGKSGSVTMADIEAYAAQQATERGATR